MQLKVRSLFESLGVELLDLDLRRDMMSQLATMLTLYRAPKNGGW